MHDKVVDPFYKSARWQHKRDRILRRDGYMCQINKRYGKRTAATMVHHIFPRNDYPQYAWCDWNLISVSQEAHNRLHDRNTDKLTALGMELLERTARRQGIDPPVSYPRTAAPGHRWGELFPTAF